MVDRYTIQSYFDLAFADQYEMPVVPEVDPYLKEISLKTIINDVAPVRLVERYEIGDNQIAPDDGLTHFINCTYSYIYYDRNNGTRVQVTEPEEDFIAMFNGGFTVDDYLEAVSDYLDQDHGDFEDISFRYFGIVLSKIEDDVVYWTVQWSVIGVIDNDDPLTGDYKFDKIPLPVMGEAKINLSGFKM